MAGKFELYTDSRGEYRFRLKASNGEVIAVSEGYMSKRAATGVDRVCAQERAGCAGGRQDGVIAVRVTVRAL